MWRQAYRPVHTGRSPGGKGLFSERMKNPGVEMNSTPGLFDKWRGPDLNRRPRGYEPRELPGCSTPRQCVKGPTRGQILKLSLFIGC